MHAALERTYLSWMGMAVTLGGVSSALVGFGGNKGTEQGKLISQTTIDIITCIYAPLSILIMVYALFTYEWRAWFLRKKQVSDLTCRAVKGCRFCGTVFCPCMVCKMDVNFREGLVTSYNFTLGPCHTTDGIL